MKTADMPKAPIVVLDDEPDIVRLVTGVLRDYGYRVVAAQSSDELFALLARQTPSLLLLDIWLQGSRLQGFDVLAKVRKQLASLPVIIISGHGNIETAVAAIKAGACDFLEKPFRVEHLLAAIRAGLKAPAEADQLYEGRLKEVRAEFERRYFSKLLVRFSGNISRIAKYADMERTALHRKLKHLDVKVARPQAAAKIPSRSPSHRSKSPK